MLNLKVLFVGTVFLAVSGFGQKPPALDEVKRELIKKVEAKEIPSVSVGVMKSGTVIWKESFGMADVEKGIAASPDTVYALGSLAKSITGTAVFRLAQDGKIRLDDPIGKHLRSVPIDFHGRNPKAYKVFHLLNMTAGIPHAWRYCYLGTLDADECAQSLRPGAFAAFAPGQVHLYSNASFGLASQMVADVAGMPFEKYLRTTILTAAGMDGTFMQRREMNGNDGKLARPYRSDGSPAADLQFEPSGGGGFYSTVNDLLKYGEIHLGRTTILDKKALAENHRVRPELPHGYYANGWGVLPIPPFGTTLLSNGAIEGAASTMLVLPDADLVVVVLVNKTVGNDLTDDLAFRIARAVLPGYKAELDKLFEKVGPLFGSKQFEGRKDLDGKWTGDIELNRKRLPLTLQFNGKMVQAEFSGTSAAISNVRVGQGVIQADLVINSAKDPFAPEKSSVELIFDLQGNFIEGTAQFDVRDDRPQFLMPAFFRLNRTER